MIVLGILGRIQTHHRVEMLGMEIELELRWGKRGWDRQDVTILFVTIRVHVFNRYPIGACMYNIHTVCIVFEYSLYSNSL